MEASENITLAIFRFEDLTQRNDLDIFCRSFSADLVTELSRFGQFQVINVSSLSSPADPSVPDLVESLKMDYFIQGTFSCEKNIVRVNVQLYDGHTQRLVWGNRLKEKLSRLGELQENLLTEVVGALQQQINYDLLSKIKKRPKVKPGAYEHWLFGMEELKRGSVENDLKARAHFEKAIRIQPDYTLAYSGMSLSYFNEWSCQLWDRWDVCRSGAYEWAHKAIELDDQNYIAALVLGKIFLYEEAYETAEYYLRKSLMLNPNDPDTLNLIAGYFVLLGFKDEAVELFERTLRLNPLNTSSYHTVGAFIFFELGDFEKAATFIVGSERSKWADAEAYYAAVYYQLDDKPRMYAHWEKFLQTYHRVVKHGEPYTTDEAIEWLQKINPHRYSTNLEPFLKFISNGKFERYELQRKEPVEKTDKGNHFIKDTAGWKLSFEGSEVLVNEVKGFYDIQKLLAQPRHLFHCSELMGMALEARGEKLVDSKARGEYQKKILDLQLEISEAEQNGELGSVEKLHGEYDRLIEHLSQTVGLRGKIREAGSPIEKARSAVTWRIRNAIARIEKQHVLLGKHLSNSIKTGTFCSYQPERDLSWHT